MIATLKGIVRQQMPNRLIVEVGGIGLWVNVPASVANIVERLGQPIFLHTYLIVRADALALYGFVTEEDREIFELLLSVSSVGPKLALAVLSTLSPEVLRSAVANEQYDILGRVPGVGKKTAERIAFNLKDKLAAGLPIPPGGITLVDSLDTEVLEALTVLGYSIVEAQSAVQNLPDDAPEDVETRIRLALQYFA